MITLLILSNITFWYNYCARITDLYSFKIFFLYNLNIKHKNYEKNNHYF